MELRQQRIADLARDLLPILETSQPQQNRLLLVSALLLLALLAGFIANNTYLRPISYSEAMVLHTLIESKAERQQLPVREVRGLLLERFHLVALEDMRASEWKDALSFLLQYRS